MPPSPTSHPWGETLHVQTIHYQTGSQIAAVNSIFPPSSDPYLSEQECPNEAFTSHALHDYYHRQKNGQKEKHNATNGVLAKSSGIIQPSYILHEYMHGQIDPLRPSPRSRVNE